MVFNEIDNFIEVYNNSVIETHTVFWDLILWSDWSPRKSLASSVIKFRPKNSVPKHCIRSITYNYYRPIPLWHCHTSSWDAIVPYKSFIARLFIARSFIAWLWRHTYIQYRPLCNFNITTRACKWTLCRSIQYLRKKKKNINLMLFNEIDNFIEVYNHSVIELVQCFRTSFFGRIDNLASSVIKLRPKNSVPKQCIRSMNL